MKTIFPDPGETFVTKEATLKVGEVIHLESVLSPTQRQTTPFVEDPKTPRETPRRFHPVELSLENAFENT